MSYWPDQDHTDRRQDNRRTGPDTFSKYVRFASFLSWMFLIISAMLADAAYPSEFNIYVLDRKWGKNSTVFFRESYMIAAFIFCVLTFFFVVISLIIDGRRQKRKSDHFSYALISALIADILGLAYFLYYFIS